MLGLCRFYNLKRVHEYFAHQLALLFVLKRIVVFQVLGELIFVLQMHLYHTFTFFEPTKPRKFYLFQTIQMNVMITDNMVKIQTALENGATV